MISLFAQSVTLEKAKERTQNWENVNLTVGKILNHAVWHSSVGEFTIIYIKN